MGEGQGDGLTPGSGIRPLFRFRPFVIGDCILNKALTIREVTSILSRYAIARCCTSSQRRDGLGEMEAGEDAAKRFSADTPSWWVLPIGLKLHMARCFV